MSGLVSADNGFLYKGNSFLAGLSSWDALADEESEFEPGFFLGMIRDNTASGDYYLSAFAGGNTYTLGDALTDQTATSMIVLKAEIEAGANDTLTAWIALAGEEELTLAGAWTGLDIADDGSDFDTFGLRARTDNSAQTAASNGLNFDEWRFGESLSDVTSIFGPPVVGDIDIQIMDSQAVVSWTGMADNVYAVQKRGDLSSGGWTNLEQNITGEEGVMFLTNSTAGAHEAFYRVVAE